MNLKDAVLVVVDTETTGLDPQKDRICEIAAVATTRLEVLSMWATLVNPGIPIPPEASAVHYLTDEDMIGAQSLYCADAALENFLSHGTGCDVIVAHNAAFDSGFLDLGDRPWICTKRLAQHLWPDAPTYKNQGLRFWRKLHVDTFGILPHRALADALVTAALLRNILASDELRTRNIETVEQLIELSNAPILFKQWPKGKYYGKPLDTDLSYAEWALGPRGMTDMDSDLRYSLEKVLQHV